MNAAVQQNLGADYLDATLTVSMSTEIPGYGPVDTDAEVHYRLHYDVQGHVVAFTRAEICRHRNGEPFWYDAALPCDEVLAKLDGRLQEAIDDRRWREKGMQQVDVDAWHRRQCESCED